MNCYYLMYSDILFCLACMLNERMASMSENQSWFNLYPYHTTTMSKYHHISKNVCTTSDAAILVTCSWKLSSVSLLLGH
jgi:hypothetical protein